MASLTALACGARTSLDLGGAPVDASIPGFDAAPTDAGRDADAEIVDSHVPPGCDAGTREIWLLSESNALYVFDPITLFAKQMSTLDCAPADGFNSMTVSRTNRGYLGAHDGSLYIADLPTGHCSRTAFDPKRYGLTSYGMGFAANAVPAGETLFIAPRDDNSHVSVLGSIDVYGSLAYSTIGAIDPPLPPTEVTGTGDRRLYGVHVSDPNTGMRGEIFQLDEATAAVFDRHPLPIVETYRAFDFAFWGGSFYVFIAYQGDVQSRVIRYTPNDGNSAQIATIDPVVIGAGVSTCAPL